MASTEVVTAEELLRLPEVTCRYELVRGTLISLPLSGRIRGRTAARFASSIGMHVDTHQLGAAYVGGTGFILSRGPDTVRAPDIAFVSKDRLPPNDEHEGYLELAPDLAVEVISPSDRMSAVLDKVAEYLAPVPDSS